MSRVVFAMEAKNRGSIAVALLHSPNTDSATLDIVSDAPIGDVDKLFMSLSPSRSRNTETLPPEPHVALAFAVPWGQNSPGEHAEGTTVAAAHTKPSGHGVGAAVADEGQ
jgi:hypothetical protein